MREYIRPGFAKKNLAAENKRLTKAQRLLAEVYELLGRVNYGHELELAKAQVLTAHKLVNAVRVTRGKAAAKAIEPATINIVLETKFEEEA